MERAQYTATNNAPSLEQWAAYQAVFNYFNCSLFEGQLPPCMLTFSRNARYYGFFAPDRWQNREVVTHEISLNPDTFDRSLKDTMSTLVHEMCHLWKFELGKKTVASGYHCKEWAAKMRSVGLLPYNLNHPEKQTGYRVSHEIGSGGAFEDAFQQMPEEYLMPWRSVPRAIARRKHTNDKVKYTCLCLLNVWGKSRLRITCDECRQRFQEQN